QGGQSVRRDGAVQRCDLAQGGFEMPECTAELSGVVRVGSLSAGPSLAEGRQAGGELFDRGIERAFHPRGFVGGRAALKVLVATLGEQILAGVAQRERRFVLL